MEIDSAAAFRAAGLFGGVVWDCLLLYDVLFDGVWIWVREVKEREEVEWMKCNLFSLFLFDILLIYFLQCHFF